ncbi:MAG: RdgB/HAM1 family non-canonical purine NTP pyrophosphatase [Clostridia bacterium]|nr:RdgB/HAM1 family non-canonical purine NTP pyrophosphatase [Clostridia bacterium]
MNYIVATHNKGKKAELERILSAVGIEVITADETGFVYDEPEETGTTFAENAYIKAKAACDVCGMPAIADDSGLCVDYLDGAPGVFTARWAGPECNSGTNIKKLLSELDGVPHEKRGARFVCSMCCVYPDGRTITTECSCEGFIADRKMGDGGFGYDPVFLMPDGRCFALISPEEKDAVSHRGKAIKELANKLADNQ